MHTGGTVTLWITQLREGDEAALGKLWQRYGGWLTRLARTKLRGAPRRTADEEDVAQEVFWGFYRSFKQGRLPHLKSRGDLMALLALITARKAASQIDHQNRAKRGAGKVQGESALVLLAATGETDRGIEQIADRGPMPEEAAILRDCLDHYLSALPENLREFAEMYLAGFSNSEIAQAKGCSKRKAERKVPLILAEWERIAAASVDRDEL